MKDFLLEISEVGLMLPIVNFTEIKVTNGTVYRVSYAGIKKAEELTKTKKIYFPQITKRDTRGIFKSIDGGVEMRISDIKCVRLSIDCD